MNTLDTIFEFVQKFLVEIFSNTRQIIWALDGSNV